MNTECSNQTADNDSHLERNESGHWIKCNGSAYGAKRFILESMNGTTVAFSEELVKCCYSERLQRKIWVPAWRAESACEEEVRCEIGCLEDSDCVHKDRCAREFLPDFGKCVQTRCHRAHKDPNERGSQVNHPESGTDVGGRGTFR